MESFMLWGGVIALLIFYYIIKPLTFWKNRGVTQPGLFLAFMDNIYMFLRTESFAEMDRKMYERFKNLRYSGAYQFSQPFLTLHDPDLIKQITVRDFDHFVDHREIVPEGADPLWEKNLFALRGQKWKEMRPILSASFTGSKMKTMFLLMTESINEFIEHFVAKNEPVIEVEMKDATTRLANDVIASTAFGVKVDSLTHPNNEFYLTSKAVTDLTGFWLNVKFIIMSLFPGITKVWKVGLFTKEQTDFFLNLVEETVKIRKEKNIIRPDMIHLLMEASKGKEKEENGVAMKRSEITSMDIAAQAMTFLFAGFDSVTNVMSMLAYELALNPDIQERLREEIEETEEACNCKLNYEALMQMKYIDIVSETMRKWPNDPGTDRVCTKPYTIEPSAPGESPLRLNVGDKIWISIFGIHRDPNYYPNPERFDPERFNEENKSKIKPYTYYPFGLGPRIGMRFALMEIKTLFYYLLLNFEIIPIRKTTTQPQISKVNFNTQIEGGFHVGLKRRQA